jgi:hypothetical protein
VAHYDPVHPKSTVFLLCFIVDRDQIMAQAAQWHVRTPLLQPALKLLLAMPITPRVCYLCSRRHPQPFPQFRNPFPNSVVHLRFQMWKHFPTQSPPHVLPGPPRSAKRRTIEGPISSYSALAVALETSVSTCFSICSGTGHVHHLPHFHAAAVRARGDENLL